MRETWYVLEDGSVADPNECAPDKSGRLKHKGGEYVAMRGQVPSTRGVEPGLERAQNSRKDMAAEKPLRGYRTRESKAK